MSMLILHGTRIISRNIWKELTIKHSKKPIIASLSNMSDTVVIESPSLLLPPSEVRGMLVLDRSRFSKEINVPIIEIDVSVVRIAMKKSPLRKYFLKIDHFKPIQSVDGTGSSQLHLGDIEIPSSSILKKMIVLNPTLIQSFKDIDTSDREALETFGVTANNMYTAKLTLCYDNWKADEVLKAILPEDKEGVASYSKVGHIIHLNLRDHFADYKKIIGQVLLDKISGARTIVNKLDTIDNTYRNFQMEVLCGVNDMMAQVRENYCVFEFDFSTVYWNPRLSTEHERIVNKLNSGDILYDVFAGVGPFAIPVAKKNCVVLANDLNPESFKWLKHNARLNKVTTTLTAFNKDGAEFVKNDVKKDMLERWQCGSFVDNSIHITMNLPALAETFANVFYGLFLPEEIESIEIKHFPIVHLYCFTKGENPTKLAKEKVEKHLGVELSEDLLIDIFNVRNVSPQKEMMRVSFVLTRDILIGRRAKMEERSNDGPPLKKIRTCDNADSEPNNGEEKAQQSSSKEEKQE